MHTGFKTDSNSESAITKNELAAAYNNSKHTTLALLSTYNETVINAHLSELKNYYKHNIIFPGFAEKLHRVEENFNRVKQNASMWKYFIPAVHLYGDNQYHRWVFGDGNWLTGRGSKYSKGIVRGDFGTSYTTRLPVIDVIRYRIGWSVFFTLVSVIIAYIVSIPIGIKSAKKKGSNFDRFSTVILFILYSLPSFWIATLLLMTFANPDNFALFPASGIGPATGIPENTGFFEAIKLRLPYLVLPTIAYTYSSFAFLSRIMRVSMLEIISQDYIRTARAKGLSEDAVIYKHAFRNALLPIITIFANIFPHAIGGSVILEYIFTIPGMGLETFIALQQQNYPMIVAVFTITGILTLTGFLISDILYALADPRISFSNH
jgi:peptide/nickel transport system permease protein